MDTIAIVAIVGVVALVAAAAWWFYSQNKRQKGLSDSFGPEYERALRESGNRRQVAKELAARKERVEKFRSRT
jgi:hypothetical protein